MGARKIEKQMKLEKWFLKIKLGKYDNGIIQLQGTLSNNIQTNNILTEYKKNNSIFNFEQYSYIFFVQDILAMIHGNVFL